MTTSSSPPSESSETSLLSKSDSQKSKKSCKSFFCPEVRVEGQHKCSLACIDKYPIHHAARMGNFKRLKELLDDPLRCKCPLQADECLGRTPLHYACSAGNVEKGLVCVKMLLECDQVVQTPNPAETVKHYVNVVDNYRKSSLHLAATNEATQIVVELLTHQASFDISSIDGACALREIYKHTPDAMEEALNQSISYIENCSRSSLPCDNVSLNKNLFDFTHTCVNVCLDFYPVVGSKRNTIPPSEQCADAEHEKCNKTKHGDGVHRTPETRFLFSVNRKRMEPRVRRQILTNALVQAFLYFKWQKVKFFCYTAILFHLIWLLLYISTLINVFVMHCPYVTKPSESQNENASEKKEVEDTEVHGTPCVVDPVVEAGAGLLLLFSCLIAVKELFQFIRLRSMYLRFENFGQCLLLAFIFITVPNIYSLGLIGWNIESLDYQISAFGIFLGWTLLLCQLAKFPRIVISIASIFGRKGIIVFPDHGIYVEILSRVFKNFLIFITIFSSLLIAFVFSFNILLPNSTGFINLPTTMVKVLTMMTGELNYDEIFHTDVQLVYPFSSHLMYAIFIMVATIILFNLLIGFTVSDIQGLQKDAEINQISNKLEQIFLMECFLLSGILQRAVHILAKICRSDSNKVYEKIMVVRKGNGESLCYHTALKTLPTHLRVKLRNHASRNCLAIANICGIARSKIFSGHAYHNFEH